MAERTTRKRQIDEAINLRVVKRGKATVAVQTGRDVEVVLLEAKTPSPLDCKQWNSREEALLLELVYEHDMTAQRLYEEMAFSHRTLPQIKSKISRLKMLDIVETSVPDHEHVKQTQAQQTQAQQTQVQQIPARQEAIPQKPVQQSSHQKSFQQTPTFQKPVNPKPTHQKPVPPKPVRPKPGPRALPNGGTPWTETEVADLKRLKYAAFPRLSNKAIADDIFASGAFPARSLSSIHSKLIVTLR